MSWICARKQRREGAMPKSPNQKLKLLYLMEILLQQTDERHPMTVPEMISELARHGVAAERKSIYNDLESLRAGHCADEVAHDRVLHWRTLV